MKWDDYVKAAEKLLSSQQVPSSLELITLVKKINPTRLTLSDIDRQRGYQLKNRLQNLLLEQYGDTFQLVPHPATPNHVLIKHRVLPSIDACHAHLAALSTEAIERVEMAVPLHQGREEPELHHGKGPHEIKPAFSAKEVLRNAQTLLDQYDYAAAEEVLAWLRIQDGRDLPVLARVVTILLEEIGAYQRCVDLLLRQPKNVLKQKGIREMLAVAYHHNGSLPEARAIFDELHPAELGVDGLLAYADIAFKDDNVATALELVQIAKGKGGFSLKLESFQKEVEAAMSAQAEPVAQKAQAALRSGSLEEAWQLAANALDLCPNCRNAREVICAIQAINDEAQVAELWAKVEHEPSGERRIALLTTLLERDRERADAIKGLIAEEKENQRRRLFDEQLESLGRLVLEERWPECFDVVTMLKRQPEFLERAGEVTCLSPFISVLCGNKRLHSTRNAKDLWLRYIKVKSAFAAGRDEDSLESWEEIKPWFGSCPGFMEDYLVLLKRQQEKARREIAALLARTEAPACGVSEARQMFGSVKKKMTVLPIGERRELTRTMEERLALLAPEQDPAQHLAEYREALQIGSRQKAAHLREEITDTEAIQALEAEFAEAFPIDLQPLEVEIADDLAFDLTTPPPLNLAFVKEQKMFLEESQDTLVMIDFATQTACRMTSPIFAKTTIADSMENNSFLFVEDKGEDEFGDWVWRAELSTERAAFTATFSMRKWFEVEDGFSVKGIMMSSERESDYYVIIKHDQGRSPAKVLRKRLAPMGTIESLQLGNRTDLDMWRWTSVPDRFIVGGEGEMRHVNRNLSLVARLEGTPKLYKIDRQNGYVYGVEGVWLTQRDHKLALVKTYQTALNFAVWEPRRVHGISFQTDTALIVIGDGRQAFYNLKNNKWSEKIRVGRVIPSYNDGKWYCFDYSRKLGKLWLRDITKDIHSKLDWREFFRPRLKRKKMEQLLMWFNEHDNFVYRPWEWEASETAVLFPTNCVGLAGPGV